VPLPNRLRDFNRRVTNRITGPLAPYAPGFGVVVHRGRRTQRLYRTPVNVFRRPGGYAVLLTYGPDTDWTRNVLAQGGCALETRGQTHELAHPRLGRDQDYAFTSPVARVLLPWLRLRLLRELNVSQFLLLDEAE